MIACDLSTHLLSLSTIRFGRATRQCLRQRGCLSGSHVEVISRFDRQLCGIEHGKMVQRTRTDIAVGGKGTMKETFDLKQRGIEDDHPEVRIETPHAIVLM